MARLRVEGLTHRFGYQRLFRNLHFELQDGESLAIVGANGTGKSTLLKIVAGVLTPTEGSVHLEVNGQKISDEARPGHVGFVAPYLTLYEAFSAEENLRFVLQARGDTVALPRLPEILRQVQLASHAHRPLRTFSTGMKQRVRLALALLQEPPLLLLDEPFSNLDAAGRALVHDLMHRHRARGGMLLLATNQPEEAALCDRTLSVEAFR